MRSISLRRFAACAAVLTAAASAAFSCDACWAQAAGTKTASKAKMEDKALTTKDGVTIHCTYFPSAAGKNAPVVILLHGKGGNRRIWHTGIGPFPGMAPFLQQNDFAVVTVDLRGHGDNIAGGGGGGKKADVQLRARDYAAMVQFDLEAVKKFLFDEHQKEALNMSKLGIVASDFSTAIALAYADLDWSKTPYDDATVPENRTPRGQDVKALVLISPDQSVPGVVTSGPAARIRVLEMPVLLCVGKQDSLDKGAAKKLGEAIMPKKEGEPHLQFEQLDTKLRGTDMLNKDLRLENFMYKFLDEKVKKNPVEWRNRKSPLMD